MKFTKPLNIITLAASFLLTTSIFTTPVTYAKSAGKPDKPSKPGKHSGLIKANKHIVNLKRCNNENEEDKLDIKVKIPHRFKAFWNYNADAHLVAAFPSDDQTGQSDFVSWNIRDLLAGNLESPDETEREHPVFKLDCDFLQTIPLGAYQFSVVLTIVDGDPTNLADWHRGFNGLLATSRIKINEDKDELDLNEDGEVDGDTDFDGLIDDDEDSNEVEVEVETEEDETPETDEEEEEEETETDIEPVS